MTVIRATVVLSALLLAMRPLYSEPKEFIVASFATSTQDQDPNVKTNIFVACRALDKYVLAPGAVFSFNDVVGEATEKGGYMNGRVMYRDEIRYEIGGGLCQVSSTLFNALLRAGCSIVERHRHFRPVTYVPAGLDATIKYGQKDLRMKNTNPYPITIETEVTGSSLSIRISAPKAADITYEMSTDEETVDVALGQEQERIRGGLNVLVYRIRMKGDKVLGNQLLYRDYYPPVYDR